MFCATDDYEFLFAVLGLVCVGFFTMGIFTAMRLRLTWPKGWK